MKNLTKYFAILLIIVINVSCIEDDDIVNNNTSSKNISEATIKFTKTTNGLRKPRTCRFCPPD